MTLLFNLVLLFVVGILCVFSLQIDKRITKIEKEIEKNVQNHRS